MDRYIEVLVFGPDLGLDDVYDAVHHLPQGEEIHTEGQLAAFDFGHIQHVVN